MKKNWRRVLTSWKKKNKGPLPKQNFLSLVNRCLREIEANTSENIKSGFLTTGIVPINSDQV
jgi:hypothetical protein